jgi:hypothetical protein
MQSSDFSSRTGEFSRRAHRKVHRIINNYPVTGSSFIPLHLDSGQVGSDALVPAHLTRDQITFWA